MTDSAQEISTDYDYDYIPGDDEVGRDPLDIEMREGMEIQAELARLIDTTMALEQFGMNPTAFGLMKSAGLLCGTSLNALAMENFRFDEPDGPETQMATEALMESVKAKLTEWSAKVMNFAKSMSDRITGILGGVWEKITTTGTALTKSAWGATKSAGTAIKAHPYKTIGAVVLAALAVAAVVAFIASGMPGAYANESALRSFIYKVQDMIGKIKWPGGKLNTDIVEGTFSKVDTKSLRIGYTMEAAAAAEKVNGTAGSMGWGQSAVKAILSQLSKVWSTLKTGVSSVASHVIDGAKKINSTGGEMGNVVAAKVAEKTKSKLAGWASGEIVKKIYNTILWGIVGVVYKLMKDIVLKAFRMVAETFAALKPAAQQTA